MTCLSLFKTFLYTFDLSTTFSSRYVIDHVVMEINVRKLSVKYQANKINTT